jgi:nucleotide-binding universal stress UspA family protein
MSGSGSARVVVGFDGSAEAKGAVGWAATAAARLDAALEIVLAWESVSPWLMPQPRLRVEQDLEARAWTLLQEAGAGLDPDLHVDRVLVQGPAAAMLVERAEDAALLVVGAHGRGGVLPGLGSIAARSAVWATVPTVVVPAAGAGPEAAPVVVGIDGSPASTGALRVALAIGAEGSPVRMVHAWAVPATAAFEIPPVEPTLIEEGGRAILDEARASLSTADRERTETVLTPGDPRSVLGAEAESASLVVVGSRGHSTVLHRLLGSTVTYLLHQHVVPVVVVPEEAADWRARQAGA